MPVLLEVSYTFCPHVEILFCIIWFTLDKNFLFLHSYFLYQCYYLTITSRMSTSNSSLSAVLLIFRALTIPETHGTCFWDLWGFIWIIFCIVYIYKCFLISVTDWSRGLYLVQYDKKKNILELNTTVPTFFR